MNDSYSEKYDEQQHAIKNELSTKKCKFNIALPCTGHD